MSPSKCVYTCSVSELVTVANTLGSRIRQKIIRPALIRQPFSLLRTVWKEIASLPVERSTLVSFGGHLLAIGGRYDSENSTSDVYRYDSHNDSWVVVSRMKNERSRCLAVALPGDGLVVVGGFNPLESDDVEILMTTT